MSTAERTEPVRTAPWDGKNLAVIQMARIPHEHGRPPYDVRIEADGWHLSVAGVPLLPGDAIEVSPSGEITFCFGERA